MFRAVKSYTELCGLLLSYKNVFISLFMTHLASF